MQIQLLAEFSATWFSNSANLPHVSVWQQGSNTQHNNRTDMTCASRSPTKHHPGTARHTHPPTKPCTHQPTHPPCYSTTTANGCVVSYSNLAKEQIGYTAEITKYCCCIKDSNNSSISHRQKKHSPTHDRHPPAQPTARQRTNPSYHKTLQPIYVLQQYSSTYELVRAPANRGDWSVLDFLA